MKLLEGKTAIITGATRGIGRGIAQKFAEQGANIAFTYLSSAAKATELEEELQNLGVQAKGYCADAGSFSKAEELIGQVSTDFGAIHVVVNNAGITRDNLLLRMQEKDWDDIMEANLKSIFNMTKAVSKIFLKQREGVFINMSSVVGISGNAGQSNYAATKAGIIGFTKSVAQELGSRNIRANVIAPGFIETEMTAVLPPENVAKWSAEIPLKRMGKVAEVADCALFLASPMSSYVTGQVIQVDGGMLT